MLKKNQKKLFRIILLGSCALILNLSSSFSQITNRDSCYIVSEGKKIELFSSLSSIKKIIPVYRDIEYPNNLIFLYLFDEDKLQINHYKILPRKIFYVDTATGKTIKYEIVYDIERGKKYGSILKKDLAMFLASIQKKSVPFLQVSTDIDFGVKKIVNSKCHDYTVDVSKIKVESDAKDFFEFKIIISIANK